MKRPRCDNPPAAVLADIARRENSLRSDERAASPGAATESRPSREGETPLEATCVYPGCGSPARNGGFCDECRSGWEDEQRAKAEYERQSINVQRGF